jgi:hypothetical protein
MDMTLSLVGVGGDARLSFTEQHIRLSWAETTRRERRMIALLIKRARKEKFTVVTVDEDGKPDKPARWKDLPGMFGKGKGQVLLQGPLKAIQEIACELVDEEIKTGSIVSVAQPDGTWKCVREVAEVQKEAGEKKTEVTSTRPTGGG